MGSKKKDTALQVSLKGCLLPALGWEQVGVDEEWKAMYKGDIICQQDMQCSQTWVLYPSILKRKNPQQQQTYLDPLSDNFFVPLNISKHKMGYKCFMLIVLMQT